MHTGQHYDDSLSAVFFAELGLAAPGPRAGHRRGLEHLADGAHARRARAAARASCEPDAALVYGDTNSTLAGALAARAGAACRWCTSRRACARSTARCPRSSTACSPTTSPSCCCARRRRAAANLRAESVAGPRRGGGRRDGRRRAAPAAGRARGHARRVRAHGVQPGEYLLLHRAPRRQRRRPGAAGRAGRAAARRCRAPVVFPVHPRTRARLRETRAAGRELASATGAAR